MFGGLRFALQLLENLQNFIIFLKCCYCPKTTKDNIDHRSTICAKCEFEIKIGNGESNF